MLENKDKRVTVSFSEKNFETYKKKARNISTEIYKMNIGLYQNEEAFESDCLHTNLSHGSNDPDDVEEKYKGYSLDFDN